MIKWLMRLIGDNVQTKEVGAQMTFYTDGSAEIHTTRGYVLNYAQNEAVREFLLDQMDEALTAFENARRRERFAAERVIPFPVSKELN